MPIPAAALPVMKFAALDGDIGGNLREVTAVPPVCPPAGAVRRQPLISAFK